MNKITGTLRKMASEWATPIRYYLRLGDARILLNDLLAKRISLKFTGKMHCIQCGRSITKTFNQGFCYPCNRLLAECDFCHIHPERCHAEAGTCDPKQWWHKHCVETHLIYLANTAALKVGITRHNQIPTRWIDQGAVAAMPIINVKNRYQAGQIEVALKQFISDRTDWRKMLRNEIADADLSVERARLLKTAEGVLQKVCQLFAAEDIEFIEQPELWQLHYPVQAYPEKVTTLSFDKTPEVCGNLVGIKGQYLLFEHGVINMRKFGGYELEFSAA